MRRRLVNQVYEQRSPRTKATVDQLMDRYLELLSVEENTRERYQQVIRVHICPLLGHLPVAELDGETLDSYHPARRPVTHAESSGRAELIPRWLGQPTLAACHCTSSNDPIPGATTTVQAKAGESH